MAQQRQRSYCNTYLVPSALLALGLAARRDLLRGGPAWFGQLRRQLTLLLQLQQHTVGVGLNSEPEEASE